MSGPTTKKTLSPLQRVGAYLKEQKRRSLAELEAKNLEKPVGSEAKTTPEMSKDPEISKDLVETGAPDPDDVTKLLELDSQMILRREQLNSNFRTALPAEDEVEDEQEEEDGNTQQSGPPEKVKASAKAKAKAKASAKAKAKAKASAKAKAKAKASAKAKAKAKASAKAKALAKTNGEKQDDVKNGSTTKPEAEVTEHAETPKSDKPDGSLKKRARRGEAGTWARTYPPSDPVQLTRYQAIKDVFMSEIAPKLKVQSAWQDNLSNDLFFLG